MNPVVRFWAKIWYGPRDSQIRFYPIGFCNIGLHNEADPFIRSKSKNMKLGIGSRNNLPDMDVTMWWYRVGVVPILPTLFGTGLCFTEFAEVVSMLHRYRYQLRYRRPYRYRRFQL